MSIQKWLGPPVSAYTQHKAAVWFLHAQIRWRWGKKVANELNPLTDLKTYTQWYFRGHRVQLGQKALRGVTLIPVVEDGKVTTKRKPKVVHLFHIRQTIRR